MTNEIETLKSEIENLKEKLATSVAYSRKLRKQFQKLKVKSGKYKHNADIFEKSLAFYAVDNNHLQRYERYCDDERSSVVSDDHGWRAREAIKNKKYLQQRQTV